MKRIFSIIGVLQLIACSSPNHSEDTSSDLNETRFFTVSILDELGDTILKDMRLPIRWPADTAFMGPVPHVITYAQLKAVDSIIVLEDMATIYEISALESRGEFLKWKRKINTNRHPNGMVNYIQELDWTTVNANQVNCIFEVWGIYGEEYLQAVTKANKAGKSLAEFHYEWTKTNQRDKDFFKHANDSVFRRSDMSNQYLLTWGDAETEAFRIIDEGVIGDLNGDGIADRLLRYNKQGVGGVCGVTRRKSGGKLEFFGIK